MTSDIEQIIETNQTHIYIWHVIEVAVNNLVSNYVVALRFNVCVCLHDVKV